MGRVSSSAEVVEGGWSRVVVMRSAYYRGVSGDAGQLGRSFGMRLIGEHDAPMLTLSACRGKFGGFRACTPVAAWSLHSLPEKMTMHVEIGGRPDGHDSPTGPHDGSGRG